MKISTELLQKILVSFTKVGPAVYHSHHDMIRFWERAVKRASLPMRLTQGFNPRPRIVFPHALGLGITSRHEAVVLELHDILPEDTILEGLRNACGDTLGILFVRSLPPVKKSLQIVSSSYCLRGWPLGQEAALEKAVAGILDMGSIITERGAPGEKRSVEVRPYLASLAVQDNALLLQLNHTPTGSARPDEIAALAAQAMGIDSRDVAIEKTAMRLE